MSDFICKKCNTSNLQFIGENLYKCAWCDTNFFVYMHEADLEQRISTLEEKVTILQGKCCNRYKCHHCGHV